MQRVRQLVADLQAQGLSPTDFEADPGNPSRPSESAKLAYAELMRRLEEDFARA
ncbi:hypothetical protein AKJ09_05364 [Labilithrix luteola]|uniref:Uncharacterized protein n=1 Tax=Labilithrix luteola TaxID=1391654 RepID=A0A0K1PYU7_9BACT|nr:hypothetical protein AKJ09_05364 [Labilithrix luteola]